MAGVVSGLREAGVMDLAVWMAGLSGGSWLVGGMHVSQSPSYDTYVYG